MVEDADVAEFKQFRLKLIGFLRLPLSVGETQLRETLRDSSENVLANYLRRAERAHQTVSRRDQRSTAAY